MAKPGIMLYFDIMPSLKFLSYEQKGKLLEAILWYGCYGTEPDFQDDMLDVVWGWIKSAIDRDSEKYEEKVSVKKYAAYCREVKKANGTPVSFEHWQKMSDTERQNLLVAHHLTSPDIT